MNRLIDFSSRFRILKGGKISLVVSAFLGSTIIANAAPSGGVVTSGNATINQSGNITNINQSTQKASINWNDFSVKANEIVNFNQPNVNSITLNRVVGNEKSVIDGALNANGQVWILNSNGILFGKNASINTAGLLATTGELSDADFQNGNYDFKNSSSNSVINLGTIKVNNSSYVILAGKEVQNGGNIEAVKGKVHLVGADSYSVNLNGNSLVNLKVNKGVLDAMVSNSGNILANGGEIFLTTNAVDELLKGVVNNTGIIEANSLDGILGKVELFAHGGEVQVGGTISTKEGFVETSGKDFTFNNAKIEAGEWLIDPVNITIDAGLASAIETQLGSGDVTIETEAYSTPSNSSVNTSNNESGTEGNITVNSDITWSEATRLTLNAFNNIYMNAIIENTNATDGGVYFQAKDTTNSVIFDSNAKVIINNAKQLQWMNTALNGNYELGSDIDLNSISWTKIGNRDSKFTGNFNGLGHTISNLTYNHTVTTGEYYFGLFGYILGGFIQNLNLDKFNITAENTNTGSGSDTGALAGQAYSNTTIKNVHVTNSIVSTSRGSGGLVGSLSTGSKIIDSAFEGTVTGGGSTGGLVSTLFKAYIENSYANAAVTSSGSSAGGLVGYMRILSDSIEAIKNSYAKGTVQGNNAGGLVGQIGADGLTIINSYASNTVTGTTNAGGIIGYLNNYSASITESYYDNEINQGTMADSSLGKTKAEILALVSNGTWDNTIWVAGASDFSGYAVNMSFTLPELQAFYTAETLFESGYGTQENPYIITNWTQLQNINNSNILTQGYYFSLLNNLGSTTDGYTTQVKDGETLANSGTGWNPIGSQYSTFTGSFDGLGHTIDALTIDNSTSSYQGLFGAVKTGSNIKNIGVTNVNIKGKIRVGALAGNNQGNISNSYSTGTVVGTGAYAGGLIGHNSGSVENSYSLAAATSSIQIGGLVGQNTGTISNSYASSSVASSDNSDTVGGLTNNFGGTVTSSWYDNETNTATMIDSDTYGKTTKEMQTLATFENAGWSIEFDETQKKIYPYLTFDENGGAIWKVGKYATALNYILGTANTTYDGTNQSLTNFWTNDIFGDVGSSLIAGTDYKFVYDSEDATAFKNAGTYNNISVVILNEDYELNETGTNTLGKFVIAKKALSITGTTTDDKTYNGNTKANVNLGTLSGFVGDETVSASAVGTFNSKDAGSRTATFEYTLEDGTNGGLANNYSLANTTDEATIQKADATVTANSDTVTYNGQTQNVNGFTASGLVGNETESVLTGITGATASGKNAGEYVTTLSGTDGNYNLTFVDGKLTISKANATVTANSNTVTYNGTSQNVNGYTVSGLVNNETSSVLDSVTGASANGTNAGTYKTSLSGSDNNYNLTFVDGQLVINKANATVTANSDTVTYNGLAQNSGFSASGLVNGETISVLDGVSVSTGTNAGTYVLKASGTDENYNLTFVDGTLTISKANATVTANSNTVTYNGQIQNVNGFTASGLVGNETESVLTGITGATASGKNAGEYVTTLSGTDGNYNLTFVNGKLVIEKANDNLSNILTPIANTTVTTPTVNIVVPPQVTFTPAPINTFNGTPVNLVSAPIQNQPTTLVSLSQLSSGGNGQGTPSGTNNIRVPVGGSNSILQIVNSGQNLPNGLDQLFFVVNTPNNNEI